MGVLWLLAGQAVAAAGAEYNGGWFAVDVYLTTLVVGGYVSLAAYLYFPAAAFSNQVRITILRAHLALTLLALAAYACQRMFVGEALPPEALVSGVVIRYIFYLTWFVNLGLLLKNRFTVQDEQTRRQANILLIGTLLGLLPILLFFALPNLVLGPQFVILPGQVSVFALVFIPISYSYVIGQRKLLRIDLLVNRALAWFILIALTLLASAGVVGLLSLWHGSPQALLFGGVLAAALVMGGLRNRIQVWVDHVLYGVSYDFGSVIIRLSERLAHISERRDLDEAVRVEFAQPMRIRQSAVLLVDQNGRLQLPWPDGTSFGMFPRDDAICVSLLDARRPARAGALSGLWDERATASWAAYAWGRVFAPLVYEHSLRGVLVLGERLTGDYYSEQDMEHIHTVSQVAALAVANLATVETLRGLGQRLVQTDEEQRRDMARELHDDVLGDLAVLRDQQAVLQPELAAHLGRLAAKVRQIIDKERAYLLEHGIALALQAMIDKLEPPAGSMNKTDIRLRNLLPDQAFTLDYKSASALYRIVQESLSNVLKHANADTAVVTLKMDRDVLEIEIWDNGIGMEDAQREPSGHYGLIGMRERAAMIGATLSITSLPGQDTTVLVRLKR